MDKLDKYKKKVEGLVESLEELLGLCDLEDSRGRLVIKEPEKIKAKQALSKYKGEQ